jgi:predicted  nucleic acid-binding Zn-ribbon protein
MLLDHGVFDYKDSNHRLVLESLVDLLETLADDCIGWSPVPERSKHLLLDQLHKVSSKALPQIHIDLSRIDQANGEWLSYRAKESAKLAKVTERLISLESQQCWKRFSYWYAQHYIDLTFANKKIPSSLQNFLDLYWVSVVAESLNCLDGVAAKPDKDVDTLTKSVMKTFCVQGDELYKYADSLVDDLRNKLIDMQISYDANALDAIEVSLVALLKQEFSDAFVPYSSIPTDSSVAEQFSHLDISSMLTSPVDEVSLDDSVDYGLKVNDWYVLGDLGSEAPAMVLLAYFKYAGTYLFANYLGMKAALYTKSEMAALIKSKQLRPLKSGERFSDVLSSCIKGLTRVADTQQKARIAAAEKAKQEAERLLEEQRLAEEAAAKRAEEIAKRAREIQKKREEKERAELEAKALEMIQQLSIGAWVSLSLESKAERYKLVVKIAASGKYIFVDRMGIKKKEYKEGDLIDLIVSNKVEFLSDGAEFEDSLQRVVSRIRMAK